MSQIQMQLAGVKHFDKANDTYKFYGNAPLKNIMDFFITHKKRCIIQDGHLNFGNNIYIMKVNQNFKIQGIYSNEFKEIRDLLYEYLSNQN